MTPSASTHMNPNKYRMTTSGPKLNGAKQTVPLLHDASAVPAGFAGDSGAVTRTSSVRGVAVQRVRGYGFLR
jgi:hypothetical protein